MAPNRLLNRNVRPVKVHHDEPYNASSSDESENDATDEDHTDDHQQHSSDEPVSEEDELEGDDVQQQISHISFGALKQANDALSRKRKRGSGTSDDQENKLEALRARLKDIKAEKAGFRQARSQPSTLESKKGRTKAVNNAASPDQDDSDSAPSEEGAHTRSRSSKHAPTSQSSKYQVTRRRTVIDVPKRTERDPRFDALRNHASAQPEQAEKAYSFLVDYQKSEIAELKIAMKATKDPDEKQALRSQVVAMENRLKAKEAKQRERDVLRRHRKEERERVQQGKQPFYLKRKEIKEQALVEKFKSMKSKDREKLMERRRKRESQREKKRMPQARRAAG